MNFAPYQSDAPEEERAKSPPLRSPTASPKPNALPPAQAQRNISSVGDHEDTWATARSQRLPSPSRYYDDPEDDTGNAGYQDIESQRFRNDYIGQAAMSGGEATYSGNVFETSLKLPLAVEATAAYLLLPPLGGIGLLMLEHQSDYVRFHAWQSALVFSGLLMVHIIFTWTRIISYLLLGVDLMLIGWLAFGAWRYAETLDRVEVPFLGRLASSFVDDE